MLLDRWMRNEPGKESSNTGVVAGPLGGAAPSGLPVATTIRSLLLQRVGKERVKF
jgi:hypothetical protein